MFNCAVSTYHEASTYEKHWKRIGKLIRLWWKICWKVNQKSTSLEEVCLTEVGE